MSFHRIGVQKNIYFSIYECYDNNRMLYTCFVGQKWYFDLVILSLTMHCLLGNYFVFKNMNQFHEKNYVWNNNVVDKNPDTDSLDVVPFRNLKKMFGFKETWNKLTCQKRRYLQKNRRSSSKIWCQKIKLILFSFSSLPKPFLFIHIALK